MLYADTVSLFFYYDDFERLMDVIRNQGNPLFIFEPIYRPGVAYFTPMFYVFFGSCYNIFGFNPIPFHLLSIATHIANSCLVSYFAFLLSRQVSWATIVGIVFATNFGVVDPVVWPSDYAEPIMFFFYIWSLITFYRYLETTKTRYYIISMLCYLLSLSSKIHAMSIPLSLLLLEVYHIYKSRKDIRFSMLAKYLPFVLGNFTYLLLLRIFVPALHVASVIDINRVFFNLFMIPLMYVIHEGIIPNSLIYPLFIDIIIVAVLALLYRHLLRKEMIWFGLSMLIIGVLVMLPVKFDFPLYPDPLGESIKTRLLLGNIGYSILISTLICDAYFFTIGKYAWRAAFLSVITIYIVLNLIFLIDRKSDFIKVTSDTESAIKQIRAQVLRLPEDKINVYIVNFPPKQGFGIALQKLFLDIKGLNLGSWPSEIPKEMSSDSLNIYLQQDGNIYDRDSNVRDVAGTAWDHFYAGQFFILTGKATEAAEELEKASVKGLWGDWKIHYFLGAYYSKSGRKEMAIEEFNKAILNNGQNADVYSLLGTLYLEKGEESKAVNNLELALRYNTADFKIMEDLALIYESRGQAKKARALFEKALPLEYRPEYRRRIEEKLQKH